MSNFTIHLCLHVFSHKETSFIFRHTFEEQVYLRKSTWWTTPHRRSASHRSARGTHPWPIRRPARFACPVWSALIRPMPPPKGSKPRSAAVHQTHPMGRHGSEEPGFRPAVVSNSWPARAWITKRCCPLFIPSPPKPASGRSARPEGFALPKRPLVCTTVPPLSIDLWLCTSEEAHLRLINRPCPGPSRGFPCSGPNT